jgi:hypothetical protein
MRERYRVSEAEIVAYRWAVKGKIPRSGLRRRAMFAVVDAFTFWPLRLLARAGVLSARRTVRRPPDEGASGSGFPAWLPIVPSGRGGTATPPRGAGAA